MNGRMLMILAAIGVVAALGLGGAAIAGAAGVFDDESSQIHGLQADRATAAALEITSGGRANSVELDSENGATYEVEVTRPDGSTVDVRLDEAFGLVVVEGDSEAADSDH